MKADRIRQISIQKEGQGRIARQTFEKNGNMKKYLKFFGCIYGFSATPEFKAGQKYKSNFFPVLNFEAERRRFSRTSQIKWNARDKNL